MPLVAPPDFEAAVAAKLGVTAYDVGSIDITVVNAAEATATTTVRLMCAFEMPTADLLALFNQYLNPETGSTPEGET